jgi:hypothetical protein
LLIRRNDTISTKNKSQSYSSCVRKKIINHTT